MMNKHEISIQGLLHMYFSRSRRFAARKKAYCNLIRNRPQSKSFHAEKSLCKNFQNLPQIIN